MTGSDDSLSDDTRAAASVDPAAMRADLAALTDGTDAIAHEVDDGEWYVVGDAVEVLAAYTDAAAAVFLDDAWARPGRTQQGGLAYDLHPFDETHAVAGDDVDDSITTTELVATAREALVGGGWLMADADDWLAPRLVDHLRTTWGDAAATPQGGGFRAIGGVTYLTDDGAPDCDTHGDHLSTGGYTVVFAHDGPTDRRGDAAVRQVATWPDAAYGRGGRAKPIAPYEAWIEALVDPGELVLVPCAGTAPAALAAKRAFGEDARYVCVDVDPDAYEAFRRRYAETVAGRTDSD